MGWQSYVVGYDGSAETREAILEMLRAHDRAGDVMLAECAKFPDRQIPDDHEWDFEGMKI